MGLIASRRHTARDLDRWAYWQRLDKAEATRWTDRKMLKAMADIERFSAAGACYAGVSWGKDSTVLAHLVACLWHERNVVVPMVWVRVEPIANPDCVLVRDAFLARFPGLAYSEIEVWCRQDSQGWHATGTLEAGFKRAGTRHVSGVRGDESGSRKLRMMTYGISTPNTCAPIGWWKAQDIWSHLHTFDLPVHPAYACSMGGMIERDRLRVASLSGQRGTGHGRAEWEWRYYPDEMRKLE